MSNPYPAGIRRAVEILGAAITNYRITDACHIILTIYSSFSLNVYSLVCVFTLKVSSLPVFRKGVQYSWKLIMDLGTRISVYNSFLI
jgi:hypothetical protein